ncbi:2-acylglycerol O-acyltransferase 2-A-like [Harmonia axyridis]|uniref:2-acylglycerol O-acyltransferase 2-A-like n=1 Tax=Harmonia axyridis TaxID=115357 RepID=UPI001E277B0C|nr:2-acylglycerol O-acyltransferase 2-A-like [Harmonia axyridis]
MGIKFAPLNVPLERRLQTASVAFTMLFFPLGGPIFLMITIYVLLFTKFWWLIAIYLTWMFLLDWKIEERGGRESKLIKFSPVCKYLLDYFPIRVNRSPWVEFKKDKNYLLCCFPHGVLALSQFNVFGNGFSEFNEYFPDHKVRVCTLKQNFYMPIYREAILAMGTCSASKESIQYLLNQPGGGHAAALVVGGVAEVYYAEPRKYKLVLKNRKGFVKIAIQSGSPLVPVFSFGETDLFDQCRNPKLKIIQEKVRKLIGLAPVVSSGRGILQYSFGIIPHRRPITVLVGPPIEVEKNEHPSMEEVDKYHQLFIDELITMFEKNKHLYIEDSEDIHIELV